MYKYPRKPLFKLLNLLCHVGVRPAHPVYHTGTVHQCALSALSQQTHFKICLQEAGAPVVFENPGCDGTEAALADCPASELDMSYFYSFYGPGGRTCTPSMFPNPDIPQSLSAFVACGSLSGPGALQQPFTAPSPSGSLLTCASLYWYVFEQNQTVW